MSYTLGKIELRQREPGDVHRAELDLKWMLRRLGRPSIDVTVLNSPRPQKLEPLTWWELEAKARYGR
jgi:hypothetical protein